MRCANADRNCWKCLHCKGKLPIRRTFHQAFYRGTLHSADGFFFVLGGRDKHKNLSDLFVLDLRVVTEDTPEHVTLGWRRFFQLEGPKSRLYSHLVQSRGEVYQFGGVSYPEYIAYDDFWKMKFGNRSLSRKCRMEFGGLGISRSSLGEANDDG